VAKIKVVERCFSAGAAVEFVMHDAAPKEGPPLPYFEAGGAVFSSDNEAVQHLARAGARHIAEGDGIDPSALAEAIAASQSTVTPAVKAAVKSKDHEVGEELEEVVWRVRRSERSARGKLCPAHGPRQALAARQQPRRSHSGQSFVSSVRRGVCSALPLVAGNGGQQEGAAASAGGVGGGAGRSTVPRGKRVLGGGRRGHGGPAAGV